MAEKKSTSSKNTAAKSTPKAKSAAADPLGPFPTLPPLSCMPKTIPYVNCPLPETVPGSNCPIPDGKEDAFPTVDCVATIPGVNCPIPTLDCLAQDAPGAESTEALPPLPTITGACLPKTLLGCPRTLPPQCPVLSAPPNCPTVQHCITLPPGCPNTQPPHCLISAPPNCPTVQLCPHTLPPQCPVLSAPPNCPTVQLCPHTLPPQCPILSAPPNCPTVQLCAHTLPPQCPILSAPPNCPTVQLCPHTLPPQCPILTSPTQCLPHTLTGGCPITLPGTFCPLPTIGCGPQTIPQTINQGGIQGDALAEGAVHGEADRAAGATAPQTATPEQCPTLGFTCTLVGPECVGQYATATPEQCPTLGFTCTLVGPHCTDQTTTLLPPCPPHTTGITCTLVAPCPPHTHSGPNCTTPTNPALCDPAGQPAAEQDPGTEGPIPHTLACPIQTIAGCIRTIGCPVVTQPPQLCPIHTNAATICQVQTLPSHCIRTVAGTFCPVTLTGPACHLLTVLPNCLPHTLTGGCHTLPGVFCPINTFECFPHTIPDTINQGGGVQFDEQAQAEALPKTAICPVQQTALCPVLQTAACPIQTTVQPQCHIKSVFTPCIPNTITGPNCHIFTRPLCLPHTLTGGCHTLPGVFCPINTFECFPHTIPDTINQGGGIQFDAQSQTEGPAPTLTAPCQPFNTSVFTVVTIPIKTTIEAHCFVSTILQPQCVVATKPVICGPIKTKFPAACQVITKQPQICFPINCQVGTLPPIGPIKSLACGPVINPAGGFRGFAANEAAEAPAPTAACSPVTNSPACSFHTLFQVNCQPVTLSSPFCQFQTVASPDCQIVTLVGPNCTHPTNAGPNCPPFSRTFVCTLTGPGCTPTIVTTAVGPNCHRTVPGVTCPIKSHLVVCTVIGPGCGIRPTIVEPHCLAVDPRTIFDPGPLGPGFNIGGFGDPAQAEGTEGPAPPTIGVACRPTILCPVQTQLPPCGITVFPGCPPPTTLPPQVCSPTLGCPPSLPGPLCPVTVNAGCPHLSLPGPLCPVTISGPNCPITRNCPTTPGHLCPVTVLGPHCTLLTVTGPNCHLITQAACPIQTVTGGCPIPTRGGCPIPSIACGGGGFPGGGGGEAVAPHTHNPDCAAASVVPACYQTLSGCAAPEAAEAPPPTHLLGCPVPTHTFICPPPTRLLGCPVPTHTFICPPRTSPVICHQVTMTCTIPAGGCPHPTQPPQCPVLSAPPNCPTVQLCPHTLPPQCPVLSAPPNCPTVQLCPHTLPPQCPVLSAPPHCPTVQLCPHTLPPQCPLLSAPPHCPVASGGHVCPDTIGCPVQSIACGGGFPGGGFPGGGAEAVAPQTHNPACAAYSVVPACYQTLSGCVAPEAEAAPPPTHLLGCPIPTHTFICPLPTRPGSPICTIGGPQCGVTLDCPVATAICPVTRICPVPSRTFICTVGGPQCGVTRLCPVQTAICPVATLTCPLPTPACPIPTAFGGCPFPTLSCPIQTLACGGGFPGGFGG